MNAVLLIVDDEASVRCTLKRRLSKEGYEVHVASSAEQGLQQLDRQMPDLLIADLHLEETDGLAFVTDVRSRDTTLPILAMTGSGSVAAAVEAMRRGATDFFEKPLDGDDVAERVARALASTALRKEVLQFEPELQGVPAHDGEVLLGQTPAMRQIYRTIRKLSRSARTTVLIEGESGTGKELVAKAIHATSARRDKPFVAINCAALTETLLEAELFGYEKGAFTGAAATGKIGLFEAADGGTVFLDEIGEMGFDLQAKLLRVLEDRQFLRVGGTESIGVDVRVIASTNRDLQERVREGGFRQDLFFRLKVVTVRTPPLRERKDDILLLAKYFLDIYNRQFDRHIEGFTSDAEKLLRSYPWPGNVRELKNAIESCVILEGSDRVSRRHLQLDAARLLHRPRPGNGNGQEGTFRSYRDGVEDDEEMSLQAMERRHILRVLNETMWQRGLAANILGIHRTTLANKIREYELADA
jgi:two-component system response regulator AtoC